MIASPLVRSPLRFRNLSRAWFARLARVAIMGALLLPVVGAGAEKFSTSAVCSQVDKSYQRKKNRDGSLANAYYAISYGGQAGGTTTDETIDHANFATFDELLKKHLAEQNYLLATDARSAELLLYINWGRSIPFNSGNYQQSTNQAANSLTSMQAALKATGTSLNRGFGIPNLPPEVQAEVDQAESDLMVTMMEGRSRDQANEFNANLLGYIDSINRANDIRRWAGGGQSYSDMLNDMEEARYYILVFAYDFRRLVERKERKLFWVTRISIRAPGNRFDTNMAAMLERAGRYFGRDSAGLVRKFEGTVELGETQVIGMEGEGDASPAPAKDSAAPATDTQAAPNSGSTDQAKNPPAVPEATP